MANIVIGYPSNVRVSGPQMVHYYQENVTGCKRRPISYSLTSKAVTCPECLRALPAPKPERPRKAWTTTSRREPAAESDRRSRAWMLTAKGQALVDKWEQEENQS